ncbi:MAG: hypothetical protein LW878_00475, partial [Proteobacteria bacterium]|nr:hypothetical protein [Pseudomonadota bacterium]
MTFNVSLPVLINRFGDTLVTRCWEKRTKATPIVRTAPAQSMEIELTHHPTEEVVEDSQAVKFEQFQVQCRSTRYQIWMHGKDLDKRDPKDIIMDIPFSDPRPSFFTRKKPFQDYSALVTGVSLPDILSLMDKLRDRGYECNPATTEDDPRDPHMTVNYHVSSNSANVPSQLDQIGKIFQELLTRWGIKIYNNRYFTTERGGSFGSCTVRKKEDHDRILEKVRADGEGKARANWDDMEWDITFEIKPVKTGLPEVGLLYAAGNLVDAANYRDIFKAKDGERARCPSAVIEAWNGTFFRFDHPEDVVFYSHPFFPPRLPQGKMITCGPATQMREIDTVFRAAKTPTKGEMGQAVNKVNDRLKRLEQTTENLTNAVLTAARRMDQRDAEYEGRWKMQEAYNRRISARVDSTTACIAALTQANNLTVAAFQLQDPADALEASRNYLKAASEIGSRLTELGKNDEEFLSLSHIPPSELAHQSGSPSRGRREPSRGRPIKKRRMETEKSLRDPITQSTSSDGYQTSDLDASFDSSYLGDFPSPPLTPKGPQQTAASSTSYDLIDTPAPTPAPEWPTQTHQHTLQLGQGPNIQDLSYPPDPKASDSHLNLH